MLFYIIKAFKATIDQIVFIIVIGMKRRTKKLSLNKHSIFIILVTVKER